MTMTTTDPIEHARAVMRDLIGPDRDQLGAGDLERLLRYLVNRGDGAPISDRQRHRLHAAQMALTKRRRGLATHPCAQEP